MTTLTASDAAALLQQEALFLDLQRWEDWLALYDDECLFWVPTWRDEHTLIDDPKSQVSFIYLRNKNGLAERVRRVSQGKSITTHPLPRTSHHIGQPLWLADDSLPEGGSWHSQWVNHQYDPRTHEHRTLFGRYQHSFVHSQGVWKIRQKIVTLVNDRIATVLDFYSV